MFIRKRKGHLRTNDFPLIPSVFTNPNTQTHFCKKKMWNTCKPHMPKDVIRKSKSYLLCFKFMHRKHMTNQTIIMPCKAP